MRNRHSRNLAHYERGSDMRTIDGNIYADVLLAEQRLNDPNRSAYDIVDQVFERVAEYVLEYGKIPRVHLSAEAGELQSEMYSLKGGIPGEYATGFDVAIRSLLKAQKGAPLESAETTRLLDFLKLFKAYLKELKRTQK